jgi:hypothetical protein
MKQPDGGYTPQLPAVRSPSAAGVSPQAVTGSRSRPPHADPD